MTSLPDKRGYFGEFGGRFVPETLAPALEELEKGYRTVGHSKNFVEELGS
ncbi:MAG: tryptophan synthase subunit beta, partial [Elusimicrobia bacterium]|nr:tryptophan synthase subunit beta [Elusimicrobiota bacterium]